MFCYFFFLLLFVYPRFVFAQETKDIDSQWQYRWGDSPVNAKGVPQWVMENIEQNEGWRSISFPSNPPNRDGKTNVWYRTVLPSGVWRDPVLYIFSIDLIAEVYLENQKIYQYGTFNKQGQGHFEGWPWHMITLPQGFSGKLIYFRVFSSASDIGLWGEVKIMERITLLKYVINNSITDVVVSGLSLLIALLSLIFAVVQSSRQQYLLISFFTFSSSVMLLAQSRIRQLLLNAPFIWDHIAATAYFVLPIAMALLFCSWCPGKFVKLIKAIWQFHVVFVCVAIGGSIFGLVELSSMYLLFDCLLATSLLILFFITFYQFKGVENNIKILISAFALFSLFLLIDMAVAHNLLPWTRMPIAIGLLLFSMVLVAVSLWHFVRVQNNLKELNATLEQKVVDRTKELERLASTDPLTKLKNRRAFLEDAERIFHSAKRYKRDVSILLADIDYFKSFNDRYGHAIGDEVLILVASCINEVCRETDLSARFGGEEFVIFLEDADKTKALIIAERLRQCIKTIKISDIKDSITVSIGISTLQQRAESVEELLLKADQAMYRAKGKGRNNCQFAE